MFSSSFGKRLRSADVSIVKFAACMRYIAYSRIVDVSWLCVVYDTTHVPSLCWLTEWHLICRCCSAGVEHVSTSFVASSGLSGGVYTHVHILCHVSCMYPCTHRANEQAGVANVDFTCCGGRGVNALLKFDNNDIYNSRHWWRLCNVVVMVNMTLIMRAAHCKKKNGGALQSEC